MGSDPVFVLGGAQTDFARNLTREGTTPAELCAEAAQAGMAAAGVEAGAIEVGHVGNFAGELVTRTAGDYQVDAAHTVATLDLGGSATTSAAFVLSAGAP